MPLISNIEVANFMNRERRTPFEPTWPHSTFPLLGLNSIINIPNGRGKTTIVKLVLFILSATKRRIDELRKIHFAPKTSGSYTHVRVQLTMDTEEGAGVDLLSGTPLGKQMVFGVYGYNGDNEEYTLYSYNGTFDDCPVQRPDSEHSKRIKLIPDKEFKEKLHSMPYRFPANDRETSTEAWRVYVEKWLDMGSIEQQIAYQLKAGGEGKSSYFDVPGKSADFARNVFYEHLAPELLHDVMGGFGEDDEKKIEDTIHEKTRQVIHARLRNKDSAQSLEHSKHILDEIELVCTLAEEMSTTAASCKDHRGKLAIEVGALRNVIIDRPIPGLPPQPPAELAEVAQYLVLCDGVPYLADRGIGVFSGEEPSVINRRADRKQTPASDVEKSQLIEIICHQTNWRDIQGRGRDNKYYDLENCLILLSHTENLAPEWPRERAVATMQAVFNWAADNADTNPARIAWKEHNGEHQRKSTELRAITEELKLLQEEKVSLYDERSRFSGQQTEYRHMQESGLFSAEELASPVKTGQIAMDRERTARESLEGHRRQVSGLQSVYREWMEFVDKHGANASPQDVLTTLVRREQEAGQKLKGLQDERNELVLKGKSLKAASNEARDKHRQLRSRADLAQKSAELADRYKTWFEGENPEGLESAVRIELKQASNERFRLEKEMTGLQDRLASIRQFRERFGSAVDPGRWLQTRLELHQALSDRRREVCEVLSVKRNDLEALKNFSVAPGQFAHNVQKNVGVAFTPLHAAIDAMSLGKGRKETLLTLFSALLFAPVLSDADIAEAAARNLADKGLEFPVFVKDDLEQFCKSGDITGGSNAARALFIGVRTRNVDCLLDPAYLEATKDTLRRDIARLGARLAGLDKAVARTAHTTATARLAERANQAIASQAEDVAANVEARLEPLLASLERLEARASDDAVSSIRGMIDYTNALNGLTIDQLSSSLAAAAELLESAESAEMQHEESRLQFDQDIDVAAIEARDAGIAKNKQEPVLTRVARFMADGEYGPAFLERAGDVEKQLAGELELAKKRAGFRFDMAQMFVDAGVDRYDQIQARLLEIEEKDPELSENKQLLSQRVEKLRELILAAQQDITKIDMGMRKLVKLYRKHRVEGLPSDVDLSANSLYRLGSYLRNCDTTQAYVKFMSRLDSELDDAGDRVEGIAKDLGAAEFSYSNACRDYDKQIEKALGDESLKLEQHVIQLLLQAKDDLSKVKVVLTAATTNYEKELAANLVAKEQLEMEWTKISNWLTEFTRRLPSNLDLMRHRFAPKRDQDRNFVSAGFIIDATVISHDDIEDVLKEIVRDIEEYEESRYLQKHREIRRDAQNTFRREIRNKFYQRVLLNPNIKVFIPSISSVKAIQLDRDIASSGQSVAISLLWIVKMSDFVSERERARKTVSMSLAARKKLRSIKSQFVFIDGAFSHLSDRSLIDDVLGEVTNARGRFQLIVTGHDPDFKPNWKLFPTMLCGREVGGKYVFVDKMMKPIEPGAVGSHIGAMSMIRTHVIKPEASDGPATH